MHPTFEIDESVVEFIGNDAVLANANAHTYMGLRRDFFNRIRTRDDFPKSFRPVKGSGYAFFYKNELDIWMRPSDAVQKARAEAERDAGLAKLLADLVTRSSLDLTERAKATTGVYLLYKAGEVIYVGQSVNVYSRIVAHRHMGYDAVKFMPCSKDELDLAESIAINLFNPPNNGPAPLRRVQLLDILESQ